jgi:hypothetical protein
MPEDAMLASRVSFDSAAELLVDDEVRDTRLSTAIAERKSYGHECYMCKIERPVHSQSVLYTSLSYTRRITSNQHPGRTSESRTQPDTVGRRRHDLTSSHAVWSELAPIHRADALGV